MNPSVVSVVLYLILGPVVGGFLAGFDRKITARMQGRRGPSIFQPFYDLFKLFSKQAVVVNNVQDFLVCGFLVFIVFTGCLFFSGGDLLLVFFAAAALRGAAAERDVLRVLGVNLISTTLSFFEELASGWDLFFLVRSETDSRTAMALLFVFVLLSFEFSCEFAL